MSHENLQAETRSATLQNVLATMQRCLDDLDRLGLPIVATRLHHAIEDLQAEIGQEPIRTCVQGDDEEGSLGPSH